MAGNVCISAVSLHDILLVSPSPNFHRSLLTRTIGGDDGWSGVWQAVAITVNDGSFQPLRLLRLINLDEKESCETSLGSGFGSPHKTSLITAIPLSLSGSLGVRSRSARMPMKTSLFLSWGTPSHEASSTSKFTRYPSFMKDATIPRAISFVPPIVNMPLTFSATKASGFFLAMHLTKCLYRKFLLSSISLLPAMLKPWHGNPPSITSTSGILSGSSVATSAQTTSDPDHLRWVSHESLSWSLAQTTSNPASLNPMSIPPAPENSDATVFLLLIPPLYMDIRGLTPKSTSIDKKDPHP